MYEWKCILWCINTSTQSHRGHQTPLSEQATGYLMQSVYWHLAIKLYCIVTTVTSNVASVLCLNSTSSVHRIWYLQFFLAEFVNVGFDFLRDGIIITNRLLFLKADSRIETEWTSWMSPHVSRPSFQNYSLSIMTSTVLFADMFLDLGEQGLGR